MIQYQRTDMGRIKNIAIKTLGDDLVAQHGGKFTDDFDSNKKALAEIKQIKSRRVRNILVGYITKKMKNIKKTGI